MSPVAEDVAVEASALELQRAVLVARMMGVAPEWASGTSAAPGWWLDTWARRLADEWLSPALRDAVLAWWEQVHEVLLDRKLAVTRLDRLQEWVDAARVLGDRGMELEALVLVEVSGRGT
jgi:hypothetical protein